MTLMTMMTLMALITMITLITLMTLMDQKNYGLAWPLWDHSFFFFCLSSLFSLSSELQRFYKNDLDTNAGTSENICTPLPSHEAKHCVQ